jgi:hypothetical protein
MNNASSRSFASLRMTGVAIALTALAFLCVPFSLFAHATVSPVTSRPGAYERYVLRVPNESDNATIRIEITFPDAVRVISFLDVPGWKLEAKMDNTGRAISAAWTGMLPPERFVELPFVAVNPKSGSRVAWPVVQTYANGQRVEWFGPVGSERPASVTAIGSGSSLRDWMPTVLASVALLVAVLALASTMRRPRMA